MVSTAALQGPVGSFVVKVKVTIPAVISAADGVYTAFAKLASSNVPVPEVVHVKLAALPEIVPPKVYVVVVLQIAASAPAFAIALGFIVNTIESFTAPQGPVGSSVVNVNVTVPAAISAAEGVYTAVADVASLNVPVPEVVQVKELAPPPIAPDNVLVSELQIVESVPALAVACGFTFIVNV